MKSKTLYVSVLLVMCAVVAQALPYKTVILDGRPTEYSTNELRGTFVGEGVWAPENVITNLYVTWDETYLYVALQGWEAGNKLVVMLDVDPGEGTGATTTMNWAGEEPAYLGFNGVGWEAADATGTEFGLDYMIATEGFFNDILRIRYDGVETPDTNNVDLIFSAGNGNTPQGTPVDMVVQADGTDCPLKGLEARIPWSELYTDDDRYGVVGANVVPTGATIRLFANLHNNNPNEAHSSPDAIPANTTWDAGLLTTDTYIDVVIDSTGDGMPDDWSGGVHAPFLRAVMGKGGGDIVYARFDKPVTTETATNTAHWWVGGLDIHSITNPQPDTVYLFLDEPLPTNGLLDVRADGVADGDGRTRETWLCLFPAEDGLDEPVTVRFVLETNSGMGGSGAGPAYNATQFFLNGDAPLEWGFPPSMNTPVANDALGGSLRYADVIFPPGTPLSVNYKFSAVLQGTNNYEAVRLDNYQDAARVLTFDPDATNGVMYVTNRLGAAAAPLRSDDEDDYNALYLDSRRGDGGVGTRKSITFQLDLSEYDTSEVQRVLVQGTDPLRGFNWNGTLSDWIFAPASDPETAGLELVDDNDDGIYTLTWALTENGRAPDLVEFDPWSLVAGDGVFDSTALSGQWADRRSPRSFKYQYYVVNQWGDLLASPGFDIEFYIEPGGPTNVVLDVAEWEGLAPDVPLDPSGLPDPTNAPMVTLVGAAPGTLTVAYENWPDQRLHVVDMTDDLVAGWRDYGYVLPFENQGTETIDVGDEDIFFARVRAARGREARGTQWEPVFVPETGGVARIYFRQDQTPHAGDRSLHVAGTFTGWADNPEPMTFIKDGLWYYDLEVPATGPDAFEFKIVDEDASTWWPEGGGESNYHVHRGEHPAVTWTPNVAEPGEALTITLDATGTPLDGETEIMAHSGFDYGGWEDRAMTNVEDQVWEVEVVMPTDENTARFSFVFVSRDAAGDVWFSEDSPDGRKFTVMIEPVGE